MALILIGKLMRNKPDVETHKKRKDAKWKIIQAVNTDRARRRPGWGPHVTLLGMKNIQQAVGIARRHKLVPSKLLEEAGSHGYKEDTTP